MDTSNSSSLFKTNETKESHQDYEEFPFPGGSTT